MPFIIIPLILAALVGLGSGFVTLDLSGSNKQGGQTLSEQVKPSEPSVIEPISILTPSPTPTPKTQVANKQPEAIPRPTNKPQVEPTSQPASDPDPIVNCHGAKGGQCENQAIKLKRSECNGSSGFVCCQIDNSWKLMSRSECAKAQNNEARDTNSASNSKPQNIDTNNNPALSPSSPYDQEWFDNMEKSLAKQKAELDQLSENPPVERQNPEYIRGTQQDVIYGRDNRRIEENEQRKASGVIQGYEPIKQDVFYGRDDRKY